MKDKARSLACGQKMARIGLGLALCALALLAPRLAAQAAEGERLLPDYFLREYDPITVFFAKDLGPAAGGPADDGAKFLSISPKQAGEYRWLDARTLRFMPAEPWPALRGYVIKTAKSRFNLATLMSPPVSMSPPAGSSGLTDLSEISLVFPQPIEIERLGEMISLEVRPLPGLGSQDLSVLGRRDFKIRERERSDRKSQARYSLRLNKPIGDGKSVTLRIKLSMDECIPGSLASYGYSTRSDFRLRAFGASSTSLPVSMAGSKYPVDQAIDCGSVAQGSRAPIFLEFTEPLDSSNSLEAYKRMVKIDPSPRELRFESSGSRLFVYFDRDAGLPYKLSLRYEGLVGSSGRTLSRFGDSSMYFYFRALESYVSWDSGQAILERYGAQSFPMRARGVEKIDLRLYRVDPLDRDFWPFPMDGLSVDESARPPMPGEEPPHGSDLTRQIRLLGSPDLSEVVSLPTKSGGPDSYFGLDLAPALSKLGLGGKSGSYLVGYRQLGAGTARNYVRFQVTDLCLSAAEEEHAVQFAVTSLSTAKPVADAEIRLEALVQDKLSTLASGRTDKAGLFRLEHRVPLKGPIYRLVVSTKDDSLVIDPAHGPLYFQDNHWFGGDSSWLSWLCGESRREAEKGRPRAYIFSERPIYRPDEKVHLQGFVRTREGGLIKASEAKRKRFVVVRGPGGAEWRYPQDIKGNGYFYQCFNEADLPSGEYTATLYDEGLGQNLASLEFKKEAYRVPSFEVDLSAPERVPFDQPFEVLLSASYYSGGKVVGQGVEWDVAEYPYSIAPSGFADYSFSSYLRSSGSYNPNASSSLEREDQTDDQGSARLSVDPRSAESIEARVYRVQAQVRGADRQTVAKTCLVKALPPFSIGLKLARFETSKMAVRPSIIVLDHEEKPLAGKHLTVRLYERQWHSYLSESDISTGKAKYVSDVVDELVKETECLSGRKPLDLELGVANAGVYIVEVVAQDEQGRLQMVKRDLFVSGPSPVAWKRTQAAVFETSLDRDVYESGQSAKLLLQSPFQDARALVAIERPEGNEYRWVDVANGQGMLSIDIRENQVPEFPVHCLLMRGRLNAQGSAPALGQDRQRPLTMANITWVKVAPAANQLKVELVHDSKAIPGGTLKIKVKVSDWRGAPVQGEAALWLVDRAVLALGKERFDSPLASFIDPVNASLRFSDTRNLAVGNLPFQEISGGDMAEEGAMAMRERNTVRRNFKTVPYYEPALKIVNGQGEATVELPDNLTEFAVRAIVSSGYDKFGIARSSLAVRLPVVVQEGLPRFIRPGDESLLGGIARVVEGPGGKGGAEIKLEGGLVLLPSRSQVARREVILDDKQALALGFSALAPPELAGLADRALNVTLSITRFSDQARDAFSMALPLRQDAVIRRIEAQAIMEKGREYTAPLPKEAARRGSVKQSAYLSAAPELISMLQALRFQASYEYGCAEQRVSRAYPVIALKAALKESGIEAQAELMGAESQNPAAFGELLTYLESCLGTDGLYAFYPGDRGQVYLSAYILEFLAAAKRSGYNVKPAMLDGPVRALKAALRSDYDNFTQGFSQSERLMALIALDSVGIFDQAYAKEFLQSAGNANLETQARLYSALRDKKQMPTSGLKKLKESLVDSLVFEKQAGALVFTGLQAKASRRDNPFFYGDIGSVAAIFSALQAEKDLSPKTSMILDYLVAKAGPDGWGDTYTNSKVLLALADYLESGKGKRMDTVEYWDGKAWLTIDTKSKPFAFVSLQTDSPLKLRLKKAGDKGGLGALLACEYAPAALGSEMKADNSGFSLQREILDYGSGQSLSRRLEAKPGQAIILAEGSVVEEHVRVINPEDRDFVAISVALAAGFEALNPLLETAPIEARPEGRLSLSPAYADYRDDKVIFYYRHLPKGSFDFYFRARANFPGQYSMPPAKAQAMYDARVYGYSNGAKVKIEAAQ